MWAALCYRNRPAATKKCSGGHEPCGDVLRRACFCVRVAYYWAMSGLNYIVGLGNQQLWDFGRAVYGSSRAGEFLRDLASGANGLDIVVVGDSNTGSAIADMYGYHHGFQQAMYERGYRCYATPVLPVVTGISDLSGDPDITNATPFVWNATNTSYSGEIFDANLRDGNFAGGSTPYSVWNPGTTWTRYGSSSSTPPFKESYAYLAANGNTFFSTSGVSIFTTHPLVANDANLTTLYYRVRYGRFVGGTGQFCPTVYSGATEITSRISVSALSTTGGVDSLAYDRSWTPTANTQYQGSWCFVASSAPTQTRGPIVIHSHSIYRRLKGWAVTSHGYQGGETSTQIATKIDAVKGAPLQEHLKELRQRQVLAGGTGRVLVFAHAGVNGAETGSEWVAAMRLLWNAYKTAWSALGYPSADLAIVAVVSHQINAADTSANLTIPGNMAQMRAAAKQMVISDPEMTTLDLAQLMPYQRLLNGTLVSGVAKSFYQRDASGNAPVTGNAHLSGGYVTVTPTWSPTDGYSEMAHHIIGALIAQN